MLNIVWCMEPRIIIVLFVVYTDVVVADVVVDGVVGRAGCC